MTKRKSDGGPEREDGEARGVSGGEPRPPGSGWWRMWGDGSCLPEMGQDVEMWHCDWSGIRCIDEFPEGSSIKGIWWRPVIARPIPATERATLPSWATRPVIDSGPVKPRIVHAWHAKDGTLFTLGSDGRIWYFVCGVGWRAPDVYPPGLEP